MSATDQKDAIQNIDMEGTVDLLMKEISKDTGKVSKVRELLSNPQYRFLNEIEKGIRVLNAAFEQQTPVLDFNLERNIKTLTIYPWFLDGITMPLGFQYQYPHDTKPEEIVDLYCSIAERAWKEYSSGFFMGSSVR